MGTSRNGKSLAIERLPVEFATDSRRVITRFFDPGGEQRIRHLLERVAKLSDAETARTVESVFQRFRTRHANLAAVLEQNYHNAARLISAPPEKDLNRRLLLGSYFTLEYSIVSTALFNPSIAPQPGQPAGGPAVHHEHGRPAKCPR
jgi:hypothetical protein